MKNEPLVIKRRGEDGSRIIPVRIKEETLAVIDRLAAEINYSRNELINIILAYGVDNIKRITNSNEDEKNNNHFTALKA